MFTCEQATTLSGGVLGSNWRVTQCQGRYFVHLMVTAVTTLACGHSKTSHTNGTCGPHTSRMAVHCTTTKPVVILLLLDLVQPHLTKDQFLFEIFGGGIGDNDDGKSDKDGEDLNRHKFMLKSILVRLWDGSRVTLMKMIAIETVLVLLQVLKVSANVNQFDSSISNPSLSNSTMTFESSPGLISGSTFLGPSTSLPIT